MSKVRFAVVRGGRDEEMVARYLPSNYRVLSSDGDEVTIIGRDSAGWTLEDYVIPRFSSGLMGCREIDPFI